MIVLYVWLCIFGSTLLFAAVLYGLYLWVRWLVQKAEQSSNNAS